MPESTSEWYSSTGQFSYNSKKMSANKWTIKKVESESDHAVLSFHVRLENSLLINLSSLFVEF